MKKITLILYLLICYLISFSQQENNTVINRHLQNNIIANTFLTDNTGKCHLFYKNSFYNKCSSTGDEWCKQISNIINISIDPKNSSILYAVNTNSNIVKSMDGGQNWVTIQNGLPTNLQYFKLLINPHNNLEIFLTSSNGIYKTTDAGFTWQLFKIGITPLEFIIHSTDKNKFYLLTNEGLSLSTDAGLTWNIISNTLPKTLIKSTGRTAYYKPIPMYSFVNVNYSDSAFILSFTEKGLYKTYNNGQSWIEANNGFTTSTFITSYFLSDNKIYLGGGLKSNIIEPFLYESDINATEWKKININSTGFKNIEGIYKDKDYSGVFIHSNEKIAYIDSSQNVIGLNYGVTSHSIVHAIASVKIGQENFHYALLENRDEIDIIRKGLWISKNKGITWELSQISDFSDYESEIFQTLNLLQISPFNPFEIWNFDYSYNYISIDGGKIWDRANQNFSYMHDFKYDPLDSNIIFFISGIDIGSRYLYRFDKKTSGVTKLSESGSYFIIDKNNNKNILTENTNLSNDGGWTWHPIKNSLEKLFKDKYSYSSQFVPINIEGSNIYATVINRNEITFIHSDNSGNEWDWKSETHQDITKLYINPKNPSNIILTYKIKENQYSSEYIGLNVTESFDYGKTWKPILNLSEKNNDIFNISKNKYKEEFNLDNFLLSMYTEQTDKPINIYISSPTGLIYTNNEGKTWKKIGGIHENK